MKRDAVYKNAVAMCILQIEESVAHLTEGFKSDFNEMPWQDIKGMRNIAAHRYGSFDTDKLYETITADIPILRAYCVNIMSRYESACCCPNHDNLTDRRARSQISASCILSKTTRYS
jgi:uncharacterized protein with HEPN domain